MSTEDNKKKNPYLIGICGGSASGKSTASTLISSYLGKENCLLFSLDNYFYGPNDEERKNIQNYNFDRPEALDLNLAYKHLLQLRNGETIDMPVYSFNISKRMPYTQKVSPKSVIIFEGIFVFYEKRMRDIMDLKLFFDVDSDIRLMRRISRDISDRSRQIDTVLDRYLTFVKPAFDMYIKPTRKYANFIIPRENFSSLPLVIISQYLNNQLSEIKDLNKEERTKKSKYIDNPRISNLSIVKDEKDIEKYDEIIINIIKNEKTNEYSNYCNNFVTYLFETQQKNKKDGYKIYYLDEKQLKKEELKDEGQDCIISIFLPILIQITDLLKNDLKCFFNSFKNDKKIKFEIMTVYLTPSAFAQINEMLSTINKKISFITIYYSEELLKNKDILVSTDKNIINEFNTIKEKYLNKK